METGDKYFLDALAVLHEKGAGEERMLCSRCGIPMRVDLAVLRDSFGADGSHVVLRRCLNGHERRDATPPRLSRVEADAGKVRCETCGKLRWQARGHRCRSKAAIRIG